MVEATWLASSDPAAMLVWLTEGHVTAPMKCRKPSDRKLRLFACAMLRQFQGRMAVQAAARISDCEKYADGDGTLPDEWPGRLAGPHGYGVVLDPMATFGLWNGIVLEPNEARAADLLREIAGNPWRAVDVRARALSKWGGWVTPTVLALARASYSTTTEHGCLEPERLWVLRDALLDAGCTEASLLDHLASSSVHVKGCWALDLLLGKE